MIAKKQRALLTSKGGLPAVPTIPALVSVAEAHEALNEGDCVEPPLSMTRNCQAKG
jgi:hypothetical protein